jgi:hypothetical protein
VARGSLSDDAGLLWICNGFPENCRVYTVRHGIEPGFLMQYQQLPFAELEGAAAQDVVGLL